MADGPVFPSFIKLEYQRGGSARSAFLADVDNTLSGAEQRFKEFSSEAQRQLDAALAVKRNQSGSLDLGVSDLQAAAKAQQARATAAREVASAMDLARQETQDYSQTTRLAVGAAQALAREEEEAASAALAHANAIDAVQARLNRQASSVEMVTSATRRGVGAYNDNTGSLRANQQAMVMAGQQLQDMAIQAQMGTWASVIFAQQVPQLAYALSGLTAESGAAAGMVGRFATFLSGPWGAALAIGAVAAGPLIDSLFNIGATADQSKEAVDALARSLQRLEALKANGVSGDVTAAQIAMNKNQSRIMELESALAKRPKRPDGSPMFAFKDSQELAALRQENVRLKGLIDVGQAELDRRSKAELRAAAAGSGSSGTRRRSGGGGTKRSNGEADQAAKQAEREAEAVARMIIDQERSVELAQLAAKGRADEADELALQFRLMDAIGIKEREGLTTALEKLGVRKAEYQAMLRNIGIQREAEREAERVADQQRRQLQEIQNVRSNLVDLFAGLRTDGLGSIGNFLGKTLSQFSQMSAERLVDQLFGNAFIDAQDAVTEANKKQAEAGLLAARALGAVAQSAGGAAGTTAGSEAAQAADALQAEIVVLGKKLKDFRDPRELYGMVFGKLAKSIGIDDEEAKRIGGAIAGALQGAAYGQLGSSLVLGGTGGAGSAIGGAFGEAAFKKLAPTLFKKLGDFAGPLGSIAGGILGGLVGKLFGGGTKYGSAAVTNSGVSIGGNNADAKSGAGSAGNSVSSAIAAIADRLGASIGSYAVSIGQTNGNWNVNPGTVNGKIGTKWQRDTIDFKKDGEAALKWAVANAIQDGAIQGISASAQRLLQKYASDVDTAVNKVLSFENVFRQLKAYKDPVGAALDDLNKEFDNLRQTFAEAGASAEEYAKLEELYGLKRADIIKQVSEQMNASLQSLLNDLTVNNDTLSLRDRKAAAMDKYSPLAARVAAGDTTAYNDFADAARVLLAIERELSGSTSAFFDLQNEVTRLTRAALDGNKVLLDASTTSSNPFSASPAAAANDNQGVIDAINGLSTHLDAINVNLGALIKQGTIAGTATNNMGYAYF